jgi:uncharacterized membrane protein YqhA
MEKFFESLLWQSRLVLLVAVISCVVTAIALVGLGVYEVIHFITNLLSYFTGSSENISRDMLVLSVIEVLDTFLISSILFIFSFGLYELFISSIEQSAGHTSQAFQINSIDQLKSKLGNVIVMLLVIKLFSYLVEMKPVTIIETLYLAVIVLLVSVSLWLGHKK